MRWLSLVPLFGCVQVYQPMSGLHRPIVVDTTATNFADIQLNIFCPRGELLSLQEASTLCQRAQILFENQGATVRTSVTPWGLQNDAFEDEPVEEDAPKMTLILELRARDLHQANDPLLWAMCIVTSTLVPAVTESTFVQDVTVRDETGFVLVTDHLEGRLIRRFGVGAWAGNRVLNFIREDQDKIERDTASEDLSRDLYRQLSQMVFNAKMRREVLDVGAAD